MRDVGRSDDPNVQAQLNRLKSVSIKHDTLSLDAIKTLLGRLDNPQRSLPPVFHVAGTNGKGSTCAFLRNILECEGYVVHCTTSPHLVRYNERIRIAGQLIGDERLAPLLKNVIDRSEGLGCSFFEITIAAAFCEFARVEADACIVEVGLGGRLDATNILEPENLAACGITALGFDHEDFLLSPEKGVPKIPIARIAFEKGGIIKPNVPVVTMGNNYPKPAQDMLRKLAEQKGAPLYEHGTHWSFDGHNGGKYRNQNIKISLEEIKLPGRHQKLNASLAIAMIQNQKKIRVGCDAIRKGLEKTTWPARMQTLAEGPLTSICPNRKLIIDGAHNLNAGNAIAAEFKERVHVILGMLDNKDPKAIVKPFKNKIKTLQVVPLSGHKAHPSHKFGKDAIYRKNIREALASLPPDDRPVLITGSLYLAGEVLSLNLQIPS